MIPSILLRALRPRALGRWAALAVVLAMPMASHAEEYIPDPTWNNGLIGADNFAGTDYNYRRGQKLVRLDNGDIIVAGIVPPVSGDPQGNAIGLARYNSAGVRQAWSNPGANGHFNNQYVVYPCGGDRSCQDVKDIVRFGDRLYVLVDRKNVLVHLAWEDTYFVDVFVFGTDGSQQSSQRIDHALSAGDGSYRTVYGGGIAAYDNMALPTVTSLVYAGTRIEDGIPRPAFSRYTVDSNGELSPQIELAAPNPGNNCSAEMHCELTGVALGGRSGTAPPRIYLSGSRWHPGPPPGTIGWEAGWDYFVMNVTSNGTPGSNLYDGWVSTEGIGNQSGGRGIAVKPGFLTSGDEIFLMVNVLQSCKDGIAVIKHEQNGAFAAGFGSAGRVRYGGSDETNTTSCNLGWRQQSIRADYPTDIVYSNGKLGVAGLNIYGPGVLCPVGEPCPEDNVDSEVAVIDSTTGAIESWRGYAYADTSGGARSRHSGFWGIVANGDDTFSLAGDVRYFNRDSVPADQRGKQMFATLRVAPRGDVIFANGFDGS